MLPAPVTALIALVPAALTLWWGRGLARLVDDPALPERLVAGRHRNRVVFVASLAVLLMTAWPHLLWTLPLLFAARMAAAYPLRKLLYGDTWSLAAYLSFFSRLAFVAYGFWMTVGALPLLVMVSGSRGWIVGVLLAAASLAWSRFYSAIFAAVMCATRVEDPAIRSRFAGLLDVAGLSAVGLQQIDLRGGVLANAVAVPSLTRPAVVVTDTLMQRLDRDEMAAILAHELAHIEHYNPRRLRRRQLATTMLILAGALMPLLLRVVAPAMITSALILWFVALATMLTIEAKQRQGNETASDLRAIALCGNPEALIRALTKLHAFARVPRRWDTDVERHATHPSLARRIQAIRAAAGTALAVLGERATFAAATGAASVTFDRDVLQWRESPTVSHSIGYGDLTMLRVDARTSGAPRLVAVDGANRRWQIALTEGDVARAQATLDIVDSRLGAVPRRSSMSPAFVRLLAVLAALVGVMANQYGVTVAAFLAVLAPASSLAVAAATAAIAAAGIVWRDRGALWMTDPRPWLAFALLVCGCALVAVRFASRRERAPASTRKLVGVLALTAAIAWLFVVSAGVDGVSVHRGARAWPSAAVLTMALAGALAFERARMLRYAAVPVAAIGVATAFIGSSAFLDRFVDDPFLAPGGDVTVTSVTGAPLTEFAVSFDVSDLWLSPTGRHVAIASEDKDEEVVIHAGPAGGRLTEFVAEDAVFVDERRVLLLDRGRRASTLRVVDLDAGNVDVWSREVPVSGARLSFDRASARWRLLGWSGAAAIASVEGRVGSDGVRETRWTYPGLAPTLQTLAVASGDVLALESRYRPHPLAAGLFGRWVTMVQPGFHSETQFWSISQRNHRQFAHSRLDLSCGGLSLDEAGATCAAYDGTRTRFFAIDPTSERLTALASVAGQFSVRHQFDGGWIGGWWQGGPVVLRPAAREAIRIQPRGTSRPYHIAIAEHVIGTASVGVNGLTIGVYAR
jgi:Zn-dependent protease with chaperone function